MNYSHDPIAVVGSSEFMYCSRCGACVGSYAYIMPCTVPPNKNDFGMSKEPETVSESFEQGLRESPLDRMDRLFRNKK